MFGTVGSSQSRQKKIKHQRQVFFLLASRSHIGKAILSQPACVSKLLSLLLDQRPSPKLVLIILQLCRAALPLMSVDDCSNVVLPPWSYSISALDTEPQDAADPASRIAALLLAKLADYVVPGERRVSPRDDTRDLPLHLRWTLFLLQGVRPSCPQRRPNQTPG